MKLSSLGQGMGVKAVNVLIIFSFLFAPLGSVLAQDAADTSSSTPVETTSSPPADTSTATTDTSTSATTDTSSAPDSQATPPPTSDTDTSLETDTSTDANTAPPANSVMALSGGGSTAPTTQNPNLFSYKNIAPQVEKSSGALTQRIKLDIPPGRKGMQPDIALEYNSQKLTDDSMVGYGWSLNIPYIERMNKRGTNNLYKDNYFYSSISGELATTTATTTPNLYYARVDDGSHIQYNYSTSTNSWTVYDKNGTRYLYGTASSTQQYDSNGDPTKVYRWALAEVRDVNDNYIEYSYSKDQNQIYPSMITYTGSGSTDGPMAVVFSLASSTVPNTTYKAAFPISTNKQISQIEASVSSSTVRTYALTYGVGANGFRPILTYVQLTGRDANGSTRSLPPMAFSYASSTPSWVSTTSRSFVLTKQSYLALPTSGNGRNDFALFSLIDYSGVNDGNINGLSVGVVPEIWANGSTPVEYGTRFFDINGDGIPDLVRAYQNLDAGGNTTTLNINTSTSTGTYNSWNSIASTSWQGVIPYFAYLSGGNNYTGGLLGNFNGDALPDFASAPYVASNSSYYGTGLGFASTSEFAPLYEMPDTSGSPATNSQMIDINGDGLDDWMYTDVANAKTYFCLNRGTSWDGSCVSPWTLATTTLYNNAGSYGDRGMRFMDVNGDNLPDFIRGYDGTGATGGAETGIAYQLFLNTGSGWATSTLGSNPPTIQASGTGQAEMADWNGDLIPDYYQYYNQASRQDVLTKITYPQGGHTDVTYQMTSQDVVNNPNLPIPTLVVSSLTTYDNESNSMVYNYTYNGGKLYLGSGLIDRKFAGFSTITERGPVATVVTYFSQGDVASTTVGERTDGYAQIGRVYRQDTSDLSGNLFKRTFNKWDTTDLGNNRWLLTLGSEFTQDYASTGSTHKDHAIEYTYATSTGDLTQMNDKGEVSGSSDGTYSDIGTDTRITNYTYATNASTTLDVISSVTVTDGSATKYKETKYKYDNLAFGSATTTNPTEIDRWISGGTYATTTNLYNSYGLLASTTDALGHTSTTTYDTLNLYPATTTNALSDSTKYVYDYATGKVATTTDPNGFVTVTVYDPVGRIAAQKQPDTTITSKLNTKQTISYVDNVYPTYTLVTDYLSSASSTEAYTYFDGIGRVLQTRTQSPTVGTYTVADKVYNNAGQLTKDSLPYFSSGSARTSATSTDALFQQYSYDALQRVTRTTNAVATTSITYGAWQKTVTDPNGNDTVYTYDAWNNLTQVQEPLTETFSGIRGYWKLDESSGNASDSTGNGYTLINTASTTYTAGKIGNGADFGTNNTSKMLSISSNLGIDGGDISMSGWVNVNTALSTTTNAQYYFLTLQSMQAGTTNTIYQIVYEYNSGSPRLKFGRRTPGNGASDSEAVYTTTLATSTWYHVALTYDGANLTGYLNGAVVATTTASGEGAIDLTTNAFQIGVRGDNNTVNSSNTASVKMDEAGVWERALGATQIAYLYNYGNGQPYSSTFTGQTAYTYNTNNDLTNITDTLGNVRNFTYDGLSRRLTAQDLHDPTDASYGTWTFTYDAMNLTKEVDPKSQTINHTYDALNRLKTDNYTGTAGNEVVYGYDSGSGNIGYLTSASTTNTRTAYTYNSIGLPKTETVTINGTSTPFKVTYAYDWQGNKTYITYPDNSLVRYVYSAQGYLDSVQEKDPWGATTTIASNLTYAPTKDFSSIVYGNGATTTNTYDPNGLYRLSNKTTVIPGGAHAQDMSYTYDAIGNITRLTDISSTTANKSVEYAYDEVNRLRFASSTTYTGIPYTASSTSLIYLVVGGGGGGAGVGSGSNGNEYAGGGGGGQVVAGTTTITTTGSYAITVGARGDRGAAGPNDGNPGSSSSFASIATAAGGSGGTHGAVGGTGGQGGASPGFGGGSGSTGGGGGGGSATTTGQGSTGTSGGNGGVGINSGISGLSRTYGSGGGGGGETTAGTGGSSAGNGGVNSAGANATTNRGGGGGGAGRTTSTTTPTYTGGHGASGVVFLSYVTGSLTATGGTISTTTDGRTVHAFTSSGTFTVTAVNSTTTLYSYPAQYQTTYTYNSIGNVLTKADTVASSSVTYAYTSTTTNANPHAPTSVGGVALTYDNNGNVTQYGNTSYTWDYDNKITQIATGTATSTYTYDYNRIRTSTTENGLLTVFPHKYYSATIGTTSTSTKRIYLGDLLVATIENVSTAPTSTPTATTTRYVFSDHLGSTNVVTSSGGSIVQTLDYYPYGSRRVNAGTDVSQREYIGEYYDESFGLNYLNNRYYDGGRGQFLSQDPSFLSIGSPKLTEILMRVNGQPNSSFRASRVEKERDRQILQQFLADPQLMNSYGYARDNPIRYSDPTGEAIPLLAILAIYGAAQTAVDLYLAKTVFIDYPDQFSAQDKKDVGFKLGLDAFISGAGRAGTAAQKAFLQIGPTTLDVLDHFFGPQIYKNMNQQSVQSQTTVQARQQFAQSYNSGFGLSTGGASGGGGMPSSNSLWVTPNGAIVTFGGQLFASAPAQSSKK